MAQLPVLHAHQGKLLRRGRQNAIFLVQTAKLILQLLEKIVNHVLQIHMQMVILQLLANNVQMIQFLPQAHKAVLRVLQVLIMIIHGVKNTRVVIHAQ
jgi:hypothetical protein